MARTFNEAEFNTRRNEILDVVQGLFYTKGYEQATIQDILNALQISKGAFYHYFDSKQRLLEALVERTSAAALEVVLPIVEDPDLGALEKFERFFGSIAAWKTDRKDFLLVLLRAWYADENALLRQKMMLATMRQFTPMLALIIRQGVAEGVFSTPYPDQIGEVLLSLFQGMGDSIGGAFLELVHKPSEAERLQGYEQIEQSIAAHTSALERVLGAEPGSLALFDTEMLKTWLVPQAIPFRQD